MTISFASSFASASFSFASASPVSAFASFPASAFFSGSALALSPLTFTSACAFLQSRSAFCQASQRSLNHSDGWRSSTRWVPFCSSTHSLRSAADFALSCQTKRMSSKPSSKVGNVNLANELDKAELVRSGCCIRLCHMAFSSSVSSTGFSASSSFSSSSSAFFSALSTALSSPSAFFSSSPSAFLPSSAFSSAPSAMFFAASAFSSPPSALPSAPSSFLSAPLASVSLRSLASAVFCSARSLSFASPSSVGGGG
mmetsp:Transcript_1200/g.2852  ORF Transcript_1200/g.2852 Transcript_1200/m.2852 type:complete len:255 (-) Transcript_1200:539-1303(-)